MNVKSSPAWSLKGRAPPSKQKETPGPGAYTSKPVNLDKDPSYSISKSERPALVKTDIKVGPGDYNTKSSLNNRNVVFGLAPRDTVPINNKYPGPGNYEAPSILSEGPKYTMSPRTSIEGSLNPVGPGQYEIKDTDKPTAYKFGSKERNSGLENKNSVPGPGAYNTLLEENAKASKFGLDKREKLDRKNTPGPGAYEIPSSIENKGITISGRNSSNSKYEGPGPGSYDMNSSIEVNRSFSVGKSKRFYKKSSLPPGPGTYNQISTERVAAPKFGKDMRKTFSDSRDIPGPGQYELKSSMLKTQGVSFKGNRDFVLGTENPGPGSYDAKPFTEGSQTIQFGSSKRGYEIEVRESYPGPGTYVKEVIKESPS